MGKSAAAVLAAVLVAAACTTAPTLPPPAAPVIAKPDPKAPRPLTLLYTTFQDHAVIQRDKPIPVWGLTAPGAQVELSFAGQIATATADQTGHWRTTLPAMKAGGPYTLAAKSSSGESQAVSDVMLGDVYLCSGQSNMELPLRIATNYDGELRGATNKQIRLFHVERFSSSAPRETFGADASWAVTSPETAKEFSAVCYYFGRDVQPAAGVAVGLIEDAWGGSVIKAWIGYDRLQALGGYDQAIAIAKAYAASPKDGVAQWNAAIRSWWEAHDPALKAAPAWNDPAFNDSDWASVVPAGTWRVWGVPELTTFNGIVWLRKTVEVTAAQAQSAATLSLGAIDSFDVTWVNGQFVGAMQGYDINRTYTIPAGTLHEGKNVIAIAVQSGAGILIPGEQMNVKFADGTTTALAGTWRWKTSLPSSQTGSPQDVPWLNQFGTSTLYNGMLLPLGDTKVRGIVWYQGESDAGNPKEYARLLPALIDLWRQKFGADTPFFAVQLPSFGPATTTPQPSNWAELREVQRKTVEAAPHAGLVVAIDLGLPDNIHPGAKQEVGHRLALLARQQIYGQAVDAVSPTPVAAERRGKTVTVRFDHVAQGLLTHEWDRVVGFQLCDGKTCHYAEGHADKTTVTLDIGKLKSATSVRFCWADSPICNLYSSAGLPAVPFEMAITAKRR